MVGYYVVDLMHCLKIITIELADKTREVPYEERR